MASGNSENQCSLNQFFTHRSTAIDPAVSTSDSEDGYPFVNAFLLVCNIHSL